MDDAAQNVGSSESFGVDVVDRATSHVGLGLWALVEGPVRTVRVVVLDVFAETGFDVASSEDEHPIEALSPDGAHEPLTGWDDVIGTHTMRAATSILEWRVVPRNNVVPVAYALVPPR